AGVQYVVYKDHFFILYQKIYFGLIGFQGFLATTKIVPIKSNIQKTKVYMFYSIFFLKDLGEPLGHKNPPWLYPNEHGIREIEMIFQKLTGQTMEDNVDLFRGKQYFLTHTL